MAPSANAKMVGRARTATVRAEPDFVLCSDISFAVCQSDDACSAFGENDDDPMTCYRNGRTVQANHFGCDVTSPSRLSSLLSLIIDFDRQEHRRLVGT